MPRCYVPCQKKGQNIVQCFIMYGFGGCGMSILTDLIATALGEFHAYFDPYILHDDEELRKMVAQLAGRIVLSAQERPQGIVYSYLGGGVTYQPPNTFPLVFRNMNHDFAKHLLALLVLLFPVLCP